MTCSACQTDAHPRDPANLVTACETCNLGKSSKLLRTPLRLVRGDLD